MCGLIMLSGNNDKYVSGGEFVILPSGNSLQLCRIAIPAIKIIKADILSFNIFKNSIYQDSSMVKKI
jgi:hypothetical protein